MLHARLNMIISCLFLLIHSFEQKAYSAEVRTFSELGYDLWSKFSGGLPEAKANIVNEAWNQQAHKIIMTKDDLFPILESLVTSVPELQMIRSKADALGVKLYLIGESAASLAHYAKAMFLSNNGDTRYLTSKLDGHFKNIFGWDPDLRIQLLVDGEAKSIDEFKVWLNNSFSYFKVEFETKESLKPRLKSSSYDFGLVDLSNLSFPMIRDFDGGTNFANDIISGSLTGINHDVNEKSTPIQLIFSALKQIEYASLFELSIEHSLANDIRASIERFDPIKSLHNADLEFQFQEAGVRIFEMTVDLDFLANLLILLDPKKKLAIDNKDFRRDRTRESMSMLYDKLFLSTKVLGRGIGATVRSMGIKYLTHTTSDLKRWAQLTRSRFGKPIFFQSRPSRMIITRMTVANEWARRGEGTYFYNGRDKYIGDYYLNAKSNNHARSGSDFEPWAQEIMVRNAAMLTILDETDGGDPVAVFENLVKNNLNVGRNTIYLERAVSDLSVNNKKKEMVDEMVMANLKTARRSVRIKILRYYERLPKTGAYSKISKLASQIAYESMISWHKNNKGIEIYPRDWFQLKMSNEHPELIAWLINNPKIGYQNRFTPDYISVLRILAENPHYTKLVIDSPLFEQFYEELYSNVQFKQDIPELIKRFFELKHKRKNKFSTLCENVLMHRRNI